MIHLGDCRRILPTLADGSVDCVVTSPPYWLQRGYVGLGDDQLGHELRLSNYLDNLTDIFGQVRRVLTRRGTLWIVIGDKSFNNAFSNDQLNGDQWREGVNIGQRQSYFKKVRKANPDLHVGEQCLIPFRLAESLRSDGWRFRQDIIWTKTRGKPQKVTTKFAPRHEHVLLLTKSPDYYFDSGAIREQGKTSMRLMWDVWQIAATQDKTNHRATFPQRLVRRCLRAGCRPGGLVLDPFIGSGTTALVARQLGLDYIGIEASAEYHAEAIERLTRQTRPDDIRRRRGRRRKCRVCKEPFEAMRSDKKTCSDKCRRKLSRLSNGSQSR